MKLAYNAPFTLTFALICIGALFAAVFTGGWTNLHLFSVGGGMDWGNPLTWLRPVTHVFGHASAEHLVYNLSMILLLGPILEEKYGLTKVISISLLTALLTAAIMILVLPGLLLGASGVVFAFIILISFTKTRSGTIPLTFVLVAFLFLGNEIYLAREVEDSVARFAHVAGGIIGGLAGLWWNHR